MNVKFLFILCLICVSCGIDRTERKIDLQQSEEIILMMEEFSIDRLELREGNLIINDTLLLSNSSSVYSSTDPRWTAHQMKIEEWIKNKKIKQETLTALFSLMTNSKNQRIVKEREVYFFNEGSWIDADWGKAYSIHNISSKKPDFSFDNVQEIKTIDDRPNWYEYYAD
ncbi:hypothetical protein [Salinimicrobium gaetbulicola]|uniref:Uncharacterized protein n=1 Tax=Salinimicrobium gaetbulicola TaxID=999702 RepID=A0ABW3IBG5_9FLAO